MRARRRHLAALLSLRAAAATVVELSDAALLGTPCDATAATRALPLAIRTLQRRSQRALTALDTTLPEEGA